MSLFSTKEVDEQSLAEKVSGVMNLPAGKIGKAVALEGKAPSTVVGVFKQFLDEPEKAIQKLLRKKNK